MYEEVKKLKCCYTSLEHLDNVITKHKTNLTSVFKRWELAKMIENQTLVYENEEIILKVYFNFERYTSNLKALTVIIKDLKINLK